MDISKHISSLLYQHECVIVPGLGGFVSNYHPAKIHPVQHLFQPPYLTILFNPELKNNDGLLTNAIAQQEIISYTNAVNIVDDFAKKTLATIRSGNKVELENVGVLYAGIEGNTLFQQDEKMNYLKGSFGLNSFISPMISRNYRGPAQKQETKFVNRRETSKSQRTIRVGAWSLVLIPLFIVLGWISMNTRMWDGFNNSNTGMAEATKSGQNIEFITNDQPIATNNNAITQPETSDEKPVVIKPETASFIPELSEPEVISDEKENSTTEAEITIINTDPEPPEIKPLPTPAQKMYHLIGGSFENIHNAEVLISSCKEQGFEDSKVIGQASNGFYRVSIAAYAKKSEAITELEKVRVSLNPNAWLLRQ